MKLISTLSQRSRYAWRTVQSALWLVGVGIIYLLLFMPAVGLMIFWNVLIPVAPLLFVLMTGLWRNICPLATTALLPRHLNISQRRKLSVSSQSKLGFIGFLLLLIIIPLRHTLFNTNGLSTALLLIGVTFVAVLMGYLFEWKSGWCSGMCPIHPVEKYYGTKPAYSTPNAHCSECFQCVTPCPDSTPNIHPRSAKKNRYQEITGFLLVGGFPGYIWGWFQIPDYFNYDGWNQLLPTYGYPLLGFLISISIYAVLNRLTRKNKKRKEMVRNTFAASAVACYYWYRLPALVGYGIFSEDGVLINLTEQLPYWGVLSITILLILFLYGWMVVKRINSSSWTKRPVFATTASRRT